MTSRARRVLILSGAVVIVVVAGAAVAVAGGRGPHSWFAGNGSTPTTSAPVPTASTQASSSPSTELSSSVPTPVSSEAATATAAPSVVATPTASSPTTQPGRAVGVVLGYADWDSAGQQVEAAGFAAGVVESGGVCTLTLTRAGVNVPVRNTAEADATTTNCGSFHVPGARLTPGAWQVTLAYQSATAHGTSATMTVTVPAA